MESLQKYFTLCFAPHKMLGWARLKYLWGVAPWSENSKDSSERDHWEMPELWENISVSWLLVIIKRCFDMVLIFLGMSITNIIFLPKEFLNLGQMGLGIIAIWMLLGIIFFPLWALFKTIILKMIITFCARSTRAVHWHPDLNDDVVATVFCSYWAYPIPIIGGILQTFLSVYYLITALRKTMHFSPGQITYVFALPVIIFWFLLVFFSLLLFLV